MGRISYPNVIVLPRGRVVSGYGGLLVNRKWPGNDKFLSQWPCTIKSDMNWANKHAAKQQKGLEQKPIITRIMKRQVARRDAAIDQTPQGETYRKLYERLVRLKPGFP